MPSSQSSTEPGWHREDQSIWVDPGSHGHVDLSTDGGETWHALAPEEALEMASTLIDCALFVRSRT